MTAIALRPLAVIMSLCLWSGHGLAAVQWDGWYGGVAAGVAKVDVTTRDWDDGTLTNIQVDNEGIPLKVIFGYHFRPWLDAEFNYTHFEDSTFSGFEPEVDSTLWQPGRVSGEGRAKGLGVEGVLNWPFSRDRFALLAKGGLFFWTTTKISRPTVAGGTLALGNEQYLHDDGISLLFGAGAEMRLAGRWHLRLEWQHTTVGFAEVKDTNVDFATVGVTLDF